MKILKLKPALKDYLWGGTRLKTDFGFQSDLEVVAEAWAFSCHPDGESIVADGEFEGKTLGETIALLGEECLGNNAKKFPFFPMLIKLIDAAKPLSIQVHPSDEYALKNENQFGKTEMWYIVDCDEGASLYYGFKEDVTKEEYERRIADGSLCDILNEVPVHKGDCFFITAGTIHAIGAGILIAEIQQNSNCTYRVFDYGRVGADGKTRPLHIEKALAVTERCAPKYPFGKPENDTLAKCEYFMVNRLNVSGDCEIYVGEESFSALLCTRGTAAVEGIEIKAGECLFVPAYYGKVKINGEAEILDSRV